MRDRRTRGVVLTCVLLGCAGGPLTPSAPAGPQPIPTAPTAPAVATATPAPTGWPAAQGAGAEAAPEPRTAHAAEPERASPTPVVAARGGCVRPEPTRSGAAQPDLRLRASGPRTLARDGGFVELSASIRNVSRARAHAIVLPGDGSDAGWRDPVISFSAFVDEGDGCWRVLERTPVMRCGLFDADWSDEIVELRAGQTRSIAPLWGFPSFAWRKGKVRLFVHYAWTGGAASKGGTSSVDPGAMAREKPYELVSNAIELVVG